MVFLQPTVVKPLEVKILEENSQSGIGPLAGRNKEAGLSVNVQPYSGQTGEQSGKESYR